MKIKNFYKFINENLEPEQIIDTSNIGDFRTGEECYTCTNDDDDDYDYDDDDYDYDYDYDNDFYDDDFYDINQIPDEDTNINDNELKFTKDTPRKNQSDYGNRNSY